MRPATQVKFAYQLLMLAEKPAWLVEMNSIVALSM